MKEIIKRLKDDLKIKKYDWLGFKISKDNPLTYHHIFKNVYGDYSNLDKDYKYNNGLPLTIKGHSLLHQIEHDDIQIYVAINKLFIIAKKEGIDKYKFAINILLKIYRLKKEGNYNEKNDFKYNDNIHDDSINRLHISRYS